MTAGRLAALALLIVITTSLVVSAQVVGRIEEARFLSLGGIEQWITIRGADRSNPILFILHGGPGDAQSSLTSTYAPLEDDFVVVQWDQRGAGRTLSRMTAASPPATLERLIDDGLELATYLRTSLPGRPLILLGHSWGSFLGVQIVKRRPALFDAFVSTGQVVSWADTVASQYRYTLERARAANNRAAVTELEALGVPAADRIDQYLVLRRWLNGYLAASDIAWVRRQDQLLEAALSPADLKTHRQGFQTMTGLDATVFAMNVRVLGFDFAVPYFMVLGSDDQLTPTALATRYFSDVQAPIKRLTVLDGAGHFALTTHMPEFVASLRAAVQELRR